MIEIFLVIIVEISYLEVENLVHSRFSNLLPLVAIQRFLHDRFTGIWPWYMKKARDLQVRNFR